MLHTTHRARWLSLAAFVVVTAAGAAVLVAHREAVRAWMCQQPTPRDQVDDAVAHEADAPDADALFQQILANPELDAPRWAYADAIRANEPERAEFIELELELAAMTGRERKQRENVKKARRRSRLLEKHAVDWIPPLGVEQVTFHRGFIAHIRVTADDWVARHAEILSLAPVQHIALTEPASDFEALVTLPALKQIRSLTLNRHRLGDQGVERLLSSPYIGELRCLALPYNNLTRRASEMLVETESLPFIKFISLRENPFGPALDYWLDQGIIIDAEPNADMKDLEAQYGEIEWLRHYGGQPDCKSYSTEASVPMQAPTADD